MEFEMFVKASFLWYVNARDAVISLFIQVADVYYETSYTYNPRMYVYVYYKRILHYPWHSTARGILRTEDRSPRLPERFWLRIY